MYARLKAIFRALTRTEKLIFIAAGTTAVVSAAILGGMIINKTTKVVPARGGEYVEGFVAQPIYLNPVIATNETDQSIIRLLFSSLNGLADKIEADPESSGRVWHVRLKEGLVWQDEEKITSDDVIFTIQKIQDPESQSPLTPSWRGVIPSRVSELELQLTLAAPYAFFPDNLKNLYVIPKHLFASIPAANWRLSDYNLKPVGSGPYAFDAFEKQPNGFISTYHLKANPRYFGDQPLIPKFTFKFFSSDDEATKSFNAGDIDGIGFVGQDNLKDIKRSYSLFSFHLPSYYAVFINQSKNLALKDDAVRAALSTSVDKNVLTSQVLGGHAGRVDGPVPPGAAYADPGLEPSSFSLEATQKALDDAGWKMGEDGVREKKIDKNNTMRLEFTLTVPQIPFLTDTAVFLQNAWKEAGIKANLDIRSSNEISDGAIKNRDYEMLLFGNVLGPNSDLLAFWHSSERFAPGFNLSLFSDKKVDTLIESIRQNQDTSKRSQDFNVLQELIVSQSPAVFLYSPDYLYLANKNLEGVESGSITEPAERFQNVQSWYLKTARVFK